MPNIEDIAQLPVSDLPVSRLIRTLSPQYLTASYKLYWFLGILDIIKDFPSEKSINIEFDDVIIRMIALSWYTILEYRLNFGLSDNLEQAVLYIEKSTGLTKISSKENIIRTLSNNEDITIKKILKDFRKFVPYRFLSTFIDNLTGIKDHKKNAAIEEASRTSQLVPYSIVDSTCILDSAWLEYFYINNAILTGWARLKLVSFIQARNPNVPAINQKLEAPCQRSLSAARKYWTDFLAEYPTKDIFSPDMLQIDSLSIDHFIPWSFVLHDQIWNLVPTSREVNSSKGNRLPPWDKFFSPFVDMQFNAFKWHKYKNPKSKILEDFLIIKPTGFCADIPRKAFGLLLENTIQPAYRIAANLGFGYWEV